MFQICKFDKTKDVGKVIPGLFPNIDELIDTHKITDNSAEVVYNGIQEIENVGIRINDEFDAIMLSRALKKAGLVANQGHGSTQQAGSSAPVSAPPFSAPAQLSE